MKLFHVEKPDDAIRAALREKIDNLTKPKGSLGVLEELAMQVGWIRQTLSPRLSNPAHIVFAGDHGIAEEGVSLSPQEVTRQMVVNFWNGGAGINFLARQHGFRLKIVDAGVNADFAPDDPIVHRKIRKGTRNYLHGPAMTRDELGSALRAGAECVQECFEEGCDTIGFGEMGITNTSSSALWMSCLTGIELNKCIGAGCDHSGAIVAHKQRVLGRALHNYTGDGSVEDVMAHFGGYEMVMAVGAMLRAAELGMVILIDGFIMTACLLAASKLEANVLHYAVYGHCGDEAGHRLLLDHLHARPLLALNLRLGEGTGALCAFPILDSAVRMLNEMGSFRQVEVTKYF
jgi:nicotinate-nucleotide--dimethylbenzimidazole phosphoribosyltransferase